MPLNIPATSKFLLQYYSRFDSIAKGQALTFRIVGIVCYVTTINGNIIKLIQSISSYL